MAKTIEQPKTQTVDQTNPRLLKFRVLRGMYVDRVDGKNVYYRRGDIVETPVDLVGKFNAPGSRKFEQIEALVQV